MKVLITGGTGFIGLLLARAILKRGTLGGAAVDAVTLFDNVLPPERPPGLDGRVSLVAGEMTDRAQVAALVDRRDIGVFHLASVVSGGGEKDFDLAMNVNLHGHLHLLEALRALGSKPRHVFASSIAVFGGSAMPEKVGDLARQTPQTTYGMTKAMGELLVNDYTRKGYIDGRSARLPTVIIRPGKPNAAASSFASGVFREPLAGVACALPVGLETVMPVSGYRTIVENFLRLYEIDGGRLGDDRSLSFPAIDATVGEMVASLKRTAKDRALGEITVESDPVIEAIVRTWPGAPPRTAPSPWDSMPIAIWTRSFRPIWRTTRPKLKSCSCTLAALTWRAGAIILAALRAPNAVRVSPGPFRSSENKDDHHEVAYPARLRGLRRPRDQRLSAGRALKLPDVESNAGGREAAGIRAFGAMLFAAAFAGSAAAQAINDYPTAARADYVFGCMKANGETRDALDRCSCSIDIVASILPYDDYVAAETFLSLGQLTGEAGVLFRTSEPSHASLTALRRAQAEAEMRCF